MATKRVGGGDPRKLERAIDQAREGAGLGNRAEKGDETRVGCPKEEKVLESGKKVSRKESQK